MYLTQREGQKGLFSPTCFDKKFYLEEEDRYVSLRVSAQANSHHQ